MNDILKEKETKKVTTTYRLYEEEKLIVDKISKKYNLRKSDIVGNLIKKYAKEEYGNWE